MRVSSSAAVRWRAGLLSSSFRASATTYRRRRYATRAIRAISPPREVWDSVLFIDNTDQPPTGNVTAAGEMSRFGPLSGQQGDRSSLSIPGALMNRDPGPTEPRATRSLDDVWHDEDRHLHAIASRMLRDPAEADDVVQEAFGRLMRVDLDEIDDTRAWLTVVVRRLCLNRLGSAYHRRESAVGATPPDETPPGLSGPAASDPADRITLDDQVQQALAVVLDQLSPAERTSFVLHDIFGIPYDEIGEIVGRTATTCRQLASRARRAVRSSPPSHPAATASVASDEHRRLVERFVAACNAGDVAGLVEVLDPDVAVETVALDGQRLGHGVGAGRVATQAMRFIGPESGSVLVPVRGEKGVDVVALYPDGRRGVFDLEIANGVIQRFRIIVVSPKDTRSPEPPADDQFVDGDSVDDG